MRIPDAEARERVLDTAAKLFYAEGVRAIGLQQVIDECRCGKSLLYRHFPSKDDLVVAYLRRMAQAWDISLRRELDAAQGDPRAQLVGVVRAVGADVGTLGYRGCPFLIAEAELADPAHPAREICDAHVADITALMQHLATQAGLRSPGQVTAQLMLVINGLRASGAALGPPAVNTAVALARDIIGSH
jgi:AcrR family transcriptional regulator